MSDRATLIIGSYTEPMPHVAGRGDGISVLRIDGATGAISPVTAFHGLRNPTYLAQSRDGKMLYAVEELDEEDGAGAAVLGLDVGMGRLSLLAKLPAKGDAPCHIVLDNEGTRLFLGNYGSGNFLTYPLASDGLPSGDAVDVRRSGSGLDPDRQEGPHVHQIVPTPDGRHVLVCDAGTDEIARHSIAGVLIDQTPDRVARTRGGSLPRHMVFSPDGTRLFVLHELACTIASYEYGEDGLTFLAEVSTLPDDVEGRSYAAAVRVHPNERFLYASNRGHDSLVAFEIGDEGLLTPIGWYATRGRTPRDFAIDPTGRYLVAANQDSHSLAVFLVDPQSGALEPIGQTHEIGSPVCVLFAEA